MADATNVLNYMIGAAWTGGKATKDAKADIENMGKAGDQAAKQVKGTETAASSFGSTMRSLVGAGIIIGAGKQLLQFGQDSIAAASSVEEMQSKFNTVFGDEAPRVVEALDDFSAAANRSKTTLMGYAATLQDTFVPLGFARDEAADMSVQLVQLAEDLGSFNDIDTATVVRDLQSALVGNTETLRKYGVVAQETQIKQEALATGLWDGAGAIDAQAKAQAILQLALKGTTDAQGDAIKTADSYANTQRGLEAAVLDLKVAIGDQLLPVATEATGRLAGLVNITTDLVNATTNAHDDMARAIELGIVSQDEWTRATQGGRVAGEAYQELLAQARDELAAYDESMAAAATMTDSWMTATDAATAAVQNQRGSLLDNYAALGEWQAKAEAANPQWEIMARQAEGASSAIGGFTGAVTGAVPPLEELNAALGLQDAAMTQVANNAGYVETLNAMGANTDIQAAKVENLQMKILGIPPTYSSTIDVDTGAAEAKINRLKGMMNSLGAARALASEVGDLGGSSSGAADYDPLNKAVGGLINPGLGSPGRDSILAMVSPGEEILRRDDPRHVLNSGGSATTVTLDLRGAVVASQQQLQQWITGAMNQQARQIDLRKRI